MTGAGIEPGSLAARKDRHSLKAAGGPSSEC